MGTSRRRRSWPRLLVRGAVVLGVVALLLALAGTISLATLPDVGDAPLRVARLLHAHQGRALGLPVPARIGQAVVAIEDERFYRHHGIDLVGMRRAGHVDLTTGARQGGSTITQQLAKALYLPDDHTLGTKLKLLGLALKLERRYSKAQILQMYLNAVYFGDGQWGIVQASRAYFGQDPGALDWAQASLLAGLPQAPSAYDPLHHLAQARLRLRAVLAALVRDGILRPAGAAAPGHNPADQDRPSAYAFLSGSAAGTAESLPSRPPSQARRGMALATRGTPVRPRIDPPFGLGLVALLALGILVRRTLSGATPTGRRAPAPGPFYAGASLPRRSQHSRACRA